MDGAPINPVIDAGSSEMEGFPSHPASILGVLTALPPPISDGSYKFISPRVAQLAAPAALGYEALAAFALRQNEIRTHVGPYIITWIV